MVIHNKDKEEKKLRAQLEENHLGMVEREMRMMLSDEPTPGTVARADKGCAPLLFFTQCRVASGCVVLWCV